MTEMKTAFINLHGKIRKIETGIPMERVSEIKSTIKAVNTSDFIEVQRAFFKGGFKDSTGKNISKQAKNIEAKHDERF